MTRPEYAGAPDSEGTAEMIDAGRKALANRTEPDASVYSISFHDLAAAYRAMRHLEPKAQIAP
ncbi:MAG TPA: hypothetical protein VMV19_01850 [Xanthobacteraceae bacterium]|nr:hypothetical protein [Xanthobacteraceae bacterium]